MPIFMVRLPAFGGSIEISSKLQGAASPACDLRLSRAINLQKWPGPAALACIVLFSHFMFFYIRTRTRRNLAIRLECSASLAFNGRRRFLWLGKVAETTPPPVVQLQKNDTRNRNTKEPIVEIEGCDSWDLTILEYPLRNSVQFWHV